MEREEFEKLSDEEKKDFMMPEQTQTLRERVIGFVSVLMMLTVISSPIWMYFVFGFELAVLTFCSVYLLLVTQSS